MASFVKRTAETRRCFKGPQATHGIISLFDASVILLQTMIEGRVGSMLDMVAQDLAESPWRGTVPIRCDRRWRMTNPCPRLLEKTLSCLPIPFLASHGIPQIAVVVSGSIHRTLFAMHVERRLIERPGAPCLSMPLLSQVVLEDQSQSRFPVSESFVRERASRAFKPSQPRHANSACSEAATRLQAGHYPSEMPESEKGSPFAHGRFVGRMSRRRVRNPARFVSLAFWLWIPCKRGSS